MMNAAVFKRTSLAMMMALAIAGCGGGGGDEPPKPVEPSTYEVIINSSNANTTADSDKICHQGTNEAACGLRMYQIMVEAFVNGDNAINYNVGYGPSDHKGDLQGIIDSLDYIKSTGANAIWLTPVFDSCKSTVTDKQLAATGYFTCDYFNVDPNFGTNQKLKDLVDAAHAKELYVILDGVFGHAITNSLPAAPVSKVSPAMIKAPKDPGYTVDYTKAASTTFFTEVATHYIKNYGIDGWRLDQSYQVPVAVWNTIRTAVEDEAAARAAAGEEWGTLGYMVAEDWAVQEDIVSDTYGDNSVPGLKSAFDFPLHYGLVQAVGAETDPAKTGDAKSLYDSWNNGVLDGGVYPDFAMPNLFIGNHDIPRFGDLLQRAKLGDVGDDAYWLRHKAAFSFMAATSGPITFYYGEEIGDQLDGFAAQNASCGTGTAWCDDNVARTTGKVEGVNGFTPSDRQKDLKTYLKSLLDMREKHPALSEGSLTRIHTDANVFISRKDTNSDNVLYLLNVKSTPAKVTLSTAALGDSGDLVNLLDTTNTVTASGGNYVITVPAFTGLFYQINSVD